MIGKSEKPNIVLASFPRSGNTFLRNVLYEVYGIYSWNNIEVYNKNLEKYHQLNERFNNKGLLNENQTKKLNELSEKFKFKVLKSHELPKKTIDKCASNAIVIYLVRDGRDALISMAHHRMDITEPGTEFLPNLKDALSAKFGTYFGGWGKNVEQWVKRADFVFRFEDFILEPIKYAESVRSMIDLPAPIIEHLPTFESQKTSGAHFGGNARGHYSYQEKKHFNEIFFRKGKVGGWKEEMPDKLQKVFWKKYGSTMEKMGYHQNGNIT